MNSVQCPICGLELEGEFEDTDEVKCPSCLATFVPSRIRRTSPSMRADAKPRFSETPPRRKPKPDKGPSRPAALIVAFSIGLVGEFLVAVWAGALGSKTSLGIAFVVWYPLLFGIFRGRKVERTIFTVLSFLRIGGQTIQALRFVAESTTTEEGLLFAGLCLGFLLYQVAVVCLVNSASVTTWMKEKQCWEASRP